MKAIITKVLPATNHRCTRIKAVEPDGKRIILAWDHGLNCEDNARRAAVALIKKMGWGRWDWRSGWAKDGYVFVALDNLFDSQIKQINEGERHEN